jgi:hypothetical protein
MANCKIDALKLSTCRKISLGKISAHFLKVSLSYPPTPPPPPLAWICIQPESKYFFYYNFEYEENLKT